MMSHPVCALCGEPMPDGEEMFKFHGYSGPCPKPPKERMAKRASKRYRVDYYEFPSLLNVGDGSFVDYLNGLNGRRVVSIVPMPSMRGEQTVAIVTERDE